MLFRADLTDFDSIDLFQTIPKRLFQQNEPPWPSRFQPSTQEALSI